MSPVNSKLLDGTENSEERGSNASSIDALLSDHSKFNKAIAWVRRDEPNTKLVGYLSSPLTRSLTPLD